MWWPTSQNELRVAAVATASTPMVIQISESLMACACIFSSVSSTTIAVSMPSSTAASRPSLYGRP